MSKSGVNNYSMCTVGHNQRGEASSDSVRTNMQETTTTDLPVRLLTMGQVGT